MQANDTLQRFIFEQAPIRGEIVRLDATWRTVLARRDYPPAVRDLLGEMAAAAMLLSATLKFTGSLIMQIQGDGTVPLLVVECTSNRTLRAIAHWTEDVRAAPLAEMMGNGRLLITISPAEGTERYQGIVELEGNSVAEVLENYLARSEQLDTRLWLASNATQVAGMLLQRLPGEQDDEDAWPRAVHLGSTITQTELLRLPAPEIIHRLYHEEDIRMFDGEPVSFRCSCSRERVTDMLRMLGHEEVQSILNEQGAVKMDCEFCGQHYELDPIDAELIFASAIAPEASSTHH
jgi:molecular chaperone Hsp33